LRVYIVACAHIGWIAGCANFVGQVSTVVFDEVYSFLQNYCREDIFHVVEITSVFSNQHGFHLSDERGHYFVSGFGVWRFDGTGEIS
jgi:hypothetical protein